MFRRLISKAAKPCRPAPTPRSFTRDALAASPNFAEALLNLGIALHSLGQEQEALVRLYWHLVSEAAPLLIEQAPSEEMLPLEEPEVEGEEPPLQKPKGSVH